MSSQQPLNNESEIWLGGMSGKNGKSCTKQIDKATSSCIALDKDDINYIKDLHVKLFLILLILYCHIYLMLRCSCIKRVF